MTGEVREADLISLLLGQRIGAEPKDALTAPAEAQDSVRDQIIDQVVQAVLEADEPLPLEALAGTALSASSVTNALLRGTGPALAAFANS